MAKTMISSRAEGAQGNWFQAHPLSLRQAIEHDEEHHVPPLAPLSITGLAVLASVAIAARPEASR